MRKALTISASTLFAPLTSAPLIARSDQRAPSCFRPEKAAGRAGPKVVVASGSVPEVFVIEPRRRVSSIRAGRSSRHALPALGLLPHDDVALTAGGSGSGSIGHGGPCSFYVLVADNCFAPFSCSVC